jgi:hypothetical protein
MTLRWRIYYGDGGVFDPGDPYQAPSLNVQMIANGDRDHGWSLIREVDYYWYDESTDEWQGGDIFGLWDYLCLPGPKKVIFGRSTTNANYNKILTQALNDPDIPQKTGWTAYEMHNAGITEV